MRRLRIINYDIYVQKPLDLLLLCPFSNFLDAQQARGAAIINDNINT